MVQFLLQWDATFKIHIIDIYIHVYICYIRIREAIVPLSFPLSFLSIDVDKNHRETNTWFVVILLFSRGTIRFNVRAGSETRCYEERARTTRSPSPSPPPPPPPSLPLEVDTRFSYHLHEETDRGRVKYDIWGVAGRGKVKARRRYHHRRGRPCTNKKTRPPAKWREAGWYGVRRCVSKANNLLLHLLHLHLLVEHLASKGIDACMKDARLDRS